MRPMPEVEEGAPDSPEAVVESEPEPDRSPAGEAGREGSPDADLDARADAAAREVRAASKGDPGRSPKPSPSRARMGRLLPWAIAVVAVGAAVAFALLWRSAESARNDAQALDHRRAQVVATATQFLGALTNFKADTIDADVRRIRSYAVGDFADQVNRFFGPTNVDALKRAKVASVGRVRSVFVQSISGPQASVFGVVDEAITNASSAPRSETLRIDVEMVETSDGWKVSSVQILQQPGGGPLG
jgi:hypothetical protein